VAATPVKSATKRPRDRKGDIAGAASRLFWAHGYPQVGIDDVAAEVGITGGAIYRHFAGKQELLARTVGDSVDALEAAVAAGDLDACVAALAALSIERRELAVLLQREARHLEEPVASEVAARMEATSDVLAKQLRAVRKDLNAGQAALLVQSALAALSSPTYHTTSLARPKAEQLVGAMGRVVLDHALPKRRAHRSVAPAAAGRNGSVRQRATRRETLLGAAIQLFAHDGYAAVRMEDIGAAAGIAGPSIYQHFAGKSDLLVAALTRAAEALQLGLSKAFAAGGSPDEVLGLVVESYVDAGVSHTDEIRVLLLETLGLPDADQHVIRRLQGGYVAEWLDALHQARPELSDAEARFLVHGVLSIVNHYVLQGGAPDLRDTMAALGRAVLATEVAP
jgi:AcrR family transcriptional regulator